MTFVLTIWNKFLFRVQNVYFIIAFSSRFEFNIIYNFSLVFVSGNTANENPIMVCHGPDPPENDPHELTPPPRHDLMMGTGEDSDDENENIGYEPLPQGPETATLDSDHDSDDDSEDTNGQQTNDVPSIESMDAALTRDAWSTPRPVDPIQMDNETVEQVMQAMANFALPQASIPEWAQTISEEEWKLTLINQIEKLRSNNR